MVIKRSKKQELIPKPKKPDKLGKPKEIDNPNKKWLSKAKNLSKKIWLPTDTGYVGGNNISDNTETISFSKINKNISENIIPKTSYKIHDTVISGGNKLVEKLKKNNIKSQQKKENALHNKLVKENPKRIKKIITEKDLTDYVITAKRIKVTPYKESRKTINDAIAASRKIWNCCINEIQKKSRIYL